MNIALYFIILFAELFILIGASVYGVGLLFSAFKGAPYVPTSKKQLAIILGEIDMIRGKTLIELGSGDGRLVRFAAKHYGIQGIGIDINPLLVWWAKILSKQDGTSNQVTFLKRNVFDYSLHKADYLYIFLMPELIVKLLPKFNDELKKGTIIISHGFKIAEYKNKLFHTHNEPTFSTFYYKM